MRKEIAKTNITSLRSYETGSFFFLLVILLSCCALFSNINLKSDIDKTAVVNATSYDLKQSEIIPCIPNSLFNEPFDNSLDKVQTNDNRKPAGELRNGIYYINLEAREGYWYPESIEGGPVRIKAFAEVGKPLQVPGPLIRVSAGTEIRATVRNSINGQLMLYGLSRPLYRPEDIKDSIVINEGETKEISFMANQAGTFLYSAKDISDSVTPASFAMPFLHSQLYGAMLVDSINEKIDPEERVFVIGMCGVKQQNNEILPKYVMNGLSWPYTERVSYLQGEAVNWRIINASVLGHPMHLHGFPFVVNTLIPGRSAKDSIVPVAHRTEVVTQFLFPMNRMRITWVPAKEGKWLFHCHLLDHVLPAAFYNNKPLPDAKSMSAEEHAKHGMGGLVMGIEVRPNKKYAKKHPVRTLPEKKLTLQVGEQPKNYFHNVNGKGFQLFENGKSSSGEYNIPGPPIVLTKNQPVAITVINKLKEPTTIHWHGLELDSYYDGVAGWGNEGSMLAPLIQPGDSFTVHITPPRAGTFIYHTHMHDKQLLDGLYGPMIVLEPGEKYQPETDKILLVSQGSASSKYTKHWIHGFSDLHFLVNGSNTPDEIQLKKNVTYRLRVINILAQENSNFTQVSKAGFYISLKKDGKPVLWKTIDKDGMGMPARLQLTIPAINQRNGPGTTRDFEFTPGMPGEYHFEVVMDQKLEVKQVIRVTD
ncbi:MAG TPA: multicopper oxidase domain-containing protein [Chitinophagaceae bacterium]